jgi:hypothetical protein
VWHIQFGQKHHVPETEIEPKDAWEKEVTDPQLHAPAFNFNEFVNEIKGLKNPIFHSMSIELIKHRRFAHSCANNISHYKHLILRSAKTTNNKPFTNAGHPYLHSPKPEC